MNALSFISSLLFWLFFALASLSLIAALQCHWGILRGKAEAHDGMGMVFGYFIAGFFYIGSLAVYAMEHWLH